MFGEELEKYTEELEKQKAKDEKELKIKELSQTVENLKSELIKKEKLLHVLYYL